VTALLDRLYLFVTIYIYNFKYVHKYQYLIAANNGFTFNQKHCYKLRYRQL